MKRAPHTRRPRPPPPQEASCQKCQLRQDLDVQIFAVESII